MVPVLLRGRRLRSLGGACEPEGGSSRFGALRAYSARSRTPFRCDGGQHSAVMADAVPR